MNTIKMQTQVSGSEEGRQEEAGLKQVPEYFLSFFMTSDLPISGEPSFAQSSRQLSVIISTAVDQIASPPALRLLEGFFTLEVKARLFSPVCRSLSVLCLCSPSSFVLRI